MKIKLPLAIFLFFLLVVQIFTGCSKKPFTDRKSGNHLNVDWSKPEKVVEAYLMTVGSSDFQSAKEMLEHPKAVVWP
jgi:hypothetical protein